MKKATALVNDIVKKRENITRMCQIKALITNTDFNIISDDLPGGEDRVYIRSGLLTLTTNLSKKQYAFFLFSDIILCVTYSLHLYRLVLCTLFLHYCVTAS